MDSIEYTVVNFEHKFAILENTIYGKINWPIKKLPDEVEIGSKIILATQNANQISTEPNPSELKKLLEELIN